ncbi:MAG: type II secretion system F family protein [Planctomycetes bacterium]|nr:type II secretion system F family protein [Planctomycetota bacterium]
MAKFKYVARDTSGNKVEDEITAKNQAAARQQLRRNGLNVLSIAESKKPWYQMTLGKPKPRVAGNDLVIFTRQFATMVEAGLPVIEILDILLEQTDDPGFKIVVTDVRAAVRSGTDLSSALAKWPKIFSPLYVNLIRAGEASGELDVILKRLSAYLEKTASLKRKIISAMAYPGVSLAAILLITIGLLTFIVPMFKEMFDDLGADLPMPTRIVMAISDTLINRWYVSVGLVVGLLVALKLTRKSARGRYFLDSMLLKAPIAGELFQKVALSRFSRTFSTMLKSGVPMLASLDIVASTAGNGVVEEAILASREAVRQGESLATPLSESTVFPPMVVRMTSVGERTGALEALMEKVADFYDEQVDTAVDSLTSVIEPVLICVMGVLVGAIVIAIFLPILSLQQNI